VASRRPRQDERQRPPQERRLQRRAGAAEAGQRLVDALQAWLAAELGQAVPMARVRALVSGGGVRVDGDVARAAGRPLRRGEHVAVLVEPERLLPLARAVDRPFTLTPARILFDDGIVLAVDKPAGLPTHATADRSRPSLSGHVEAWLRQKGRPVTLAVHQRLDRDTTGVVLFGIDARANAGLATAFASHQAVKTYLALAASPERRLPPHFLVDAPIGAAAPGGEGVRVDGKGAKPAQTEVVVREVLEDALLVEARPLTGRRHQLRAHLAHAGVPVLGDRVYGGSGPTVPRLMLHAWRLALPHPTTGKALVIESAIPADFAAVLAQLRPNASSARNG
jgi:23S rRNA pseudouridine1911/1915/1917 synthase